MSVVGGAVRNVGRTVNRAASATTAAAGAVGGAAINGVVGGVKGAAEGIQRGIGSGSKSTPAAALAIAALGVTGIVEWPILLAVGGGALVLRKLGEKPQEPQPPTQTRLASVPDKPAAEKAAPRKTAAKTPAKTAKKATGRRAGTTNLRSTN
ncbi:hypothetical protein A5791_13620 [Mycobacterium sp. 852002-51163_SCH5372311]|uniref:hypothetical protein n=1 Tax=Mycobacterium sp. 852002-51163_SCH5372311 TaxID=1834097 RepID=UPI000800DBCF|nr:hypothetical protein [Mycobacterium sp. 852002-51163_SCH5372311]OBF92953.1 hypothetical protein A5791_13620 [Mycobacterium sp. 852002-51163_SCH5372311]